jgi:hypothetical protein
MVSTLEKYEISFFILLKNEADVRIAFGVHLALYCFSL